MTLRVYASSICAGYDQLLPGLSAAAEWSLWLCPLNRRFEPADIAEMGRSFRPLRGIVWQGDQRADIVWWGAFPGGALPASIEDAGGPFKDWPGLVDNLVSQVAIQFQVGGARLYSGTAWFSPDARGDLADLVSSIQVGASSAIAFIPGDEKAGQQWSNIVGGLEWLCRCRRHVATAATPPLDADAVALSYVRLTAEIGGVPGLAWAADSEHGLAFFGPRSVLEDVADRLVQRSANQDDALSFERLWRRGLQLEVVP